MVWVWVYVAFLAVNVGTVFLPATNSLWLGQLGGLGLLLGVNFRQGREQAEYVKERLGDDYIKNGWGLPLLVSVTVVGAYLAGIFFLVAAVDKPDPADLAVAVKPLILQEWQKRPELRGASIQSVKLVHKRGKVYTGFVDATVGGQSVRLSVVVVYDRGTVSLEFKP
jgi:hypothetical protein